MDFPVEAVDAVGAVVEVSPHWQNQPWSDDGAGKHRYSNPAKLEHEEGHGPRPSVQRTEGDKHIQQLVKAQPTHWDEEAHARTVNTSNDT